MKQLLPSFSFVHPSVTNLDTSILNNVDIVFFYTNYLSHALYYKVIDDIREHGVQFRYLKDNTNENIVLKQIYKEIVKDQKLHI